MEEDDGAAAGNGPAAAAPNGSGQLGGAAALPSRQQLDAQRQYLEDMVSNLTAWGCADQVTSIQAKLKSVEAQLQQPALKGSIVLRQALHATRAQREKASPRSTSNWKWPSRP